MKILNLKLKISSKGEIASALTIISLGLMLLGAVAGTRLATTPQQTKTLAAYPDWKWDEASVGCTDATCICGNISRVNSRQSGGVCAPVCKLDGSQKCISNKWDDTWGCWGDAALDCKLGLASPTPAGPTPTGPTPTSGSGTGPPSADCTAGEWKCNNNEANADTKNLFCSVWCDGRNQWLFEASRAYFDGDGTKCGGKASAPRSGGCPDTATPVPTRPPSGGGPPGGGGGTNPSPGGGSTPTPAPNGFLVVKSGPNGYIELNAPLTPHPSWISVNPIDNTASGLTEIIDNEYTAFPFPTGSENTLSGTNWTYKYKLTTRDKPLIKRLNFNASSPLAVNLDLYSVNAGDGIKIPQNYNICYPPNIPTPASGQTWSTVIPTIIEYCDTPSRSNIIQYSGSSGPSITPILPTLDPNDPNNLINPKFELKMDSVTYNYELKIKDVTYIYYSDASDSGTEIIDSDVYFSPPKLTFNQRSSLEVINSSVVKQSPVDRKYRLSIESEVVSKNAQSANKYECPTLLEEEYIIKAGSIIPEKYPTIHFGIQYTSEDDLEGNPIPEKCVVLENPLASILARTGSLNSDFASVISNYSQGKISAIDVSKFVSQLTRVPGLQIVSCDPTRGECSAGF